jgi:hypothetical protein
MSQSCLQKKVRVDSSPELHRVSRLILAHSAGNELFEQLGCGGDLQGATRTHGQRRLNHLQDLWREGFGGFGRERHHSIFWASTDYNVELA